MEGTDHKQEERESQEIENKMYTKYKDVLYCIY